MKTYFAVNLITSVILNIKMLYFLLSKTTSIIIGMDGYLSHKAFRYVPSSTTKEVIFTIINHFFRTGLCNNMHLEIAGWTKPLKRHIKIYF